MEGVVGVHSGTPSLRHTRYSDHMYLTYKRSILAASWMAAILAGGLVAGAGSTSTWLLLAAIAIVPPVALVGRMNAPPKTLSESIGEVLR